MKFSIKKKGYDTSEVDNFVSEAEQSLEAQKERIQKLKSKVAVLERELEIYREKKDLIMAALTEAAKKAEEIEQIASQKYNLEIQRLREFHARWTDHYDKLLNSFSSSDQGMMDFNRDMDKIFRESELQSNQNPYSAESLYKNEKKRLEKIASQQMDIDISDSILSKVQQPASTQQILSKSHLTPLERIKMYLRNNNDISAFEGENLENLASEERVLSLEEALHPTQDLKDIMRDLGLIEE